MDPCHSEKDKKHQESKEIVPKIQAKASQHSLVLSLGTAVSLSHGGTGQEQPGCHLRLSPGTQTPDIPEDGPFIQPGTNTRVPGSTGMLSQPGLEEETVPPKVTRFEAGCHIPSSLRNGADFRSIPVPPCSSCDVSAVTASHGVSQGGVFKLPKPALTALCSSHGLEISLEGKSCWEKKKARRKHNFSLPQKTPNQEETQVFSPKILQGENPARMSQNGFNPPRGKSPCGVLRPFGTGGTNPNPAAGDLWLPLSEAEILDLQGSSHPKQEL